MSDVSAIHDMACSLLTSLRMTVTRIVQLVDGEELISYESGERQRTSFPLDDPRRGALERRASARSRGGDDAGVLTARSVSPR